MYEDFFFYILSYSSKEKNVKNIVRKWKDREVSSWPLQTATLQKMDHSSEEQNM